ncbi:MAG TPA: CHASE3 domain-containing protein [Polyangiaceae bacterium]|nr:CHASE3 domain-containing protein [Polyangiaceae bacterium]
MLGSWTFGKRLGAGFAVAALVLVVVALFGYQNAERLTDDSRWVVHTLEVRTKLADFLAAVAEAETSVRGYVVTNEDVSLEPYRSAIPKTREAMAEVQRLTSDNPAQQRRVTALRAVVDTKLTHLASVAEAREKSGFPAAQALMVAGVGRRAMDEIRRLIGEMDHEEATLLERRSSEAEASSRTTRGVMIWGSMLGVLFVAVVGYFISSTLSRQIGSAVQHIQSSSTELQAAANQQATGSREQATAMNEITTTISELLATSRQIAGSSQRVAQIASETASSALSGDQVVQRTHESINAIKRQVDQVVTHMLDLGKKSQEIGGILEIINELAEQTNILAINATIEAAGAGDAGKRFAVVAEEIRRLADRVGGSTKDIRGLIDEVRAAVNTTVMATESGTKAVDAGARQFGDAASAFGQIRSLVSTTTEAAREIELSTKQQASAVEQVNAAIANVAQASRETEASSGQTLQTASQLAGLSRELLKVIQVRVGA